jgi:PST family polysaccharide transporter
LEKVSSKVFIKYLIISLSGILILLSEFHVREIINLNHDQKTLGLWQGLNRISASYMSWFAIVGSFFLIPKFSNGNKKNINIAIFKYSIFIIMLFSIISIVFYVTKNEIVSLILKDSFLEIGSAIYYQLFSDLMRVIGWIFGFYMIAKCKFKQIFVIEFLQYIVIVLSYRYLIIHTESLNNIMLISIFNSLFYVCLVYSFYYINRFERNDA